MCTPRAEYLQSAHETSADGITNFAVPSGLQEQIDELFYQEWQMTTDFYNYDLDHEPLFSTLLQVNRKGGENLDMYVSVDDLIRPSFSSRDPSTTATASQLSQCTELLHESLLLDEAMERSKPPLESLTKR